MTANAEKLENVTNARTPPYVAYKTFLTLIEDLKANGVPPQFDRSVLKRFSGGVGSQLLMAIKSLGLVTERNTPTAILASLVKTAGTPDFKAPLKEALRFGYPFLSGLDLMTATPGMFADAFKVTGAKEDVLKKCRRFYLQAAEDAGIPIGPRLSDGQSAPRAPSEKRAGQPRVAREKTPRAKVRELPETPSAQSIQQQLVGKYPDFDPAWPDNVKAAWFDGFHKLMAGTIGDPKQKGGQ